MPDFKKESFGKLSDGREATVYTLRNTKGNELKVTDFGARIVSVRFRDKSFSNKFVLKTYPDVAGFEKDDSTGAVFVDGGADFAKILWQAEQLVEGVKFTGEAGGKKVSVLYSISNDNEISITYESDDTKEISTQLNFDGAVLPDAEISPYSENATKGKIFGNQVYKIIDKPAEVEMELGMFGYDPGCPIDYLDAGLKNAADIFSPASGIELKVYATQNELHVAEIDGGFSVKTSGGGKNKSQTVYVLKNRK